METNDVVISGIQLKKLIARKVEPIMQECDLRPVELDVLVFLHGEKSIDTATGIIQKKHLSKAHISKSVEHLHAKGYIRLREDENDLRILHIRLTERSEELVGKVIRVYEECRDIMQRGILPEEMEIVKKVLAKINRNINQELGESFCDS